MANNIKKKILKNRFISYAIAILAWGYSNLLFATCRFIVRLDKQAEAILDSKAPFIMLAWHGRLFIWPQFMKRYGKFYAVISSHSDGDYVARFIKLLRHGSIRGSSKNGGFLALSQLIKNIKAGRGVCLTPDGPRGPRFQIHNDILTIANKLHVPIIIFSYSATKCKLFNTWDRFLCPFPFSQIFINISLPNDNNLTTLKDLTHFMVEDMKEIDRMANIKVHN